MIAASARYRILRRLGQGGMAEVFEAELAGDLGFVRKVAIKRMLPEAAASIESAQRFLDEARIASRLHDANIVSVLDVGLLDGLPFQVLELVDGLNAQQLQQRAGGVLPLEIALIIVNDVAHALDHAHTATDADGRPLGIVHRDVKPSNVLVSWNGDVKLTDFGIAFAHDRAARTEAGLVPGTRGFIAPEQRMRTEMDGRTDVFALGLSLHAMLTGYTPLQDVTVEMSLLTGQAIQLDGMLPAEIRDLIARAVTPARRDRMTAAQLAEQIGAMLAPRLQRDARGYLREFLATLRDDRPKAGALDRLLGLDMVLTAEAVGDAPRRFELRSTEIAAPNADNPTVAETPAAKQEPATPTRVAPTGRRTATLAIAAGLVAGGGGLAAWRLLAEPPAARHAVVATDASIPVVATDAEVVATAVLDAGIPVLDGASEQPTTIAHVHPTRRDTRKGSATGASAAVHETVPPVPTPTPDGTGFVQVIGEQNIGAKIVVDGKDIGYAPNKLEVARGRHRLVVVRKDGTRDETSIEVTDYHTVQRPLRPTL